MSELQLETCAAVLEGLPAGVYIVDRNRRILFWNDGAEKITGYLRHEVIGRSCPADLLAHCDQDNNVLCGSACPLEQTLHDGRPRDLKLFLRHRQGHRIPVRVRSLPVRDAAGVLIGAAETFDEHVHLVHPEAHPLHHICDDGKEQPPGDARLLTEIQGALADFATNAAPFGVLGIEVDHLEQIRRSHGRRAVEAILRVVWQTLSKNLPVEDLLCRWSGDRSIVILVNCPAAALPRVAGMLQRIVGMAEVEWWGDRIRVKASLGGTVAHHGDTAAALLGRVESALANLEPPASGSLVFQ